MLKFAKIHYASVLAAFFLLGFYPSSLKAQDPVETAGVAVGLTAGNLVFVPAKAISVSVGLLSGALSFVLTGGNADLTKQIWRDTTQGPYLITPEVAYKAVGQRPELREQK
jgi:predicted permease